MNGSKTDSMQFDSSMARDRAAARSPRALIIILALIVGGTALAITWGPREMARWYLAAARNAHEDLQYEDALKAANKGLEWHAQSPLLLRARAALRYELGDMQGSLEDYGQAIELAATPTAMNEADAQLLVGRAQTLQRLDRYQEAIDDWTKVVEFRREQYEQNNDAASQYNYAITLNNRAYTQGQGGIDIEGALKDIDRAIELRGTEDDPVLIDTLGYLLLLDGQHERALYHLETAVALAKVQDDEEREKLKERMQQVVDQRRFELRLKTLDEQYSVILHHRGEAYQATGELEKAKSDFAEAEILGYNPAEGIW